MKKEISFELKEEKLNGERLIEYKLYSQGGYLDYFRLDHDTNEVHVTIHPHYATLFGLGDTFDYKWYIKFFGIIPPLTKEEAIEKIHALIDEINDGWVPNWKDRSEHKYYLFYSYGNGCFNYDWHFKYQYMDVKYCKDSCKLQKLIDNNEELLKIAFGAEDGK